MVFDTAGAGNFFSWGSSFAYLLLGAAFDIFKGGKKIANLKIMKNRYLELVEKYAQQDLIAVKEVNNALNIINQDLKNEQISLSKLELKNRNYKISSKKYKNGVIAASDILDEKISLIQQEQIALSAKALRLIDYFTLYKAVGGAL